MSDPLPYIQQGYAPVYANCYGCGPAHPEGLHLKSYPAQDGETTFMQHRPDVKFTGGVPQNLYGGAVAMLLDCHGTASAAYFDLRCRGGSFPENPLRRFVTAHLEINFRRPTPLDCLLTVYAKPIDCSERKVRLCLELFADDRLTADGEMVAVAL